ncbi:MAG: response regulator [Planctomycetota bacterium]|jgi:signal transduction histidine kinase/CheY-like chemotaxis protein/HPt (histidine-containing phosphotransfer) domain-containing protein|nr:response regulator [Planctomycetota bacterium]
MLVDKFHAALASIIVLIIAVGAVMIGGVLTVKHNDILRTLATIERNGIYDAEKINNWVEKTISFVATFAGGVANLGEDFPVDKMKGAIDIHLARHPEFFRVHMGYADGSIISSDHRELEYKNYTPLERPWYFEAVNHPDRVIITEIFDDYQSGLPCISFAKAVRSKGKVLGVISADIFVSTLQEILNTVQVEANDSYAFIADMRCNVLFRQTGNPTIARLGFNDITANIAKYQPRMAEDLMAIKSGKSALLALQSGEERYYSAHDIRAAEWRLYTSTSAEELLKPIDRHFNIMVGALTFMLVLIVIMMILTHVILRRAARVAREESQMKSIFLANMSHEIRTPLNAIIGLSELALSSGALPPSENDDINKIYAAGVTLLSIVNNILDLSKVESGKMELIPVEYNVPSLINDTLALISAYTGSKEVEFRLHIDETLPSTLFGDDLRIKQILNNLLSNAFKYTNKGSVDWSIRAERAGNHIWMISSIRDTGIGIRPENLQKIFSNYSQVDTKNNRAIQGTGLGLAIAKKMAEMMDGSLTVESEYGFGSVFTVRVRQNFVNDQTIGADTAKKLSRFEYLRHKRDRNQNAARADLSYARVLVVDDVTTNLVVAQGLLKRYKLQVDCLTSGKRAVEAIREAAVKYDAIMMDHMMPEMDGVEATHLIRAIGTPYAKNIPIIALTANAVSGMARMFLANGFNDFISKPIDITLLDVALNRWVRDRAKETDAAAAAVADTPPAAPAVSVAPRNAPGDGGWQDAVRNLPGLNVEIGLANCGGTWEVYGYVLQAFVTDTTRMLAEIRDPKPEAAVDYATYTHGIKGSSNSAGLTALGEQAKQLELAAKAGNFNFVAENNAAFVAAAEAAIAAIKKAIAKEQLRGGELI